MISRITVLVCATSMFACNLVDDEPPMSTSATDTDNATAGLNPTGEGGVTCDVAEALAVCQPPLQATVQWVDAGGTMVLVDDPAATVGVGPGLVQVNSSADYVGTYVDAGGTCLASCAWCQPGQSYCHSGLTDEGFPECGQCLPFDLPDVGYQCAAVISACMGGGGTIGGGTTGSSDLGFDETGEESFTCTDWDPKGGVVAEGAARFLVDPGLVFRIADDGGLPLSECDGTKFRRTSGGRFMISKMASDGFLGLLGFAPGDVIEGIGDVELSGMDEIVQSVQGLLSDLPDHVVLRSRRKGVERFTTVVFE